MKLKIGSHELPLPDAKWLRIALGLVFLIGSFLSFLPVLGIWMLPVGIILLAIDLPFLKPVKDWITKKVQQWFGTEIKEEKE